MADFWNDITEKLGAVAGKWTAYTAFGSFVLYLLGYLSLRFQLTAFGVGTNLDLFNEKYLFAGMRFVVYLISSIPTLLLFVTPLAAIAWLFYRIIPDAWKISLKDGVAKLQANPTGLVLAGIVLSVLQIQVFMRKCFGFSNLLLAKELPGPGWLNSILLSESDVARVLYFDALLAGALVSVAVLRFGTCSPQKTPFSKFLIGLLAFLTTVEFLLMTIIFGVLISTQDLPRVAQLCGDRKLTDSETAWMVVEDKDAITYLVRNGTSDKRTLLTIPRKEWTVEIVRWDPIMHLLFSGKGDAPKPQAMEGRPQ